MDKKKKIRVWAVAAVIVAGGCYFLLGKKGGRKVSLETAQVYRTSITNSVTATGTVEPVTEVDVGTQVSGIVDKLYVDYNDVVKAGQLIAEMDKVTLEAELQSATAQLASSKAEFEYQQKNYARYKVLFEKELISDYDYETATYNYEVAKAAYEQRQAAMVQVRRNLEYATINSPIDGVVINKSVEEGQTVAASFETPTIVTIAADLTKMQVVADVDEADIGGVAEGQRVSFTVDAYPNDVFDGVVEQIRLGESDDDSSSSSSSTVVTYEVVITADNPELKLKPRLTANVTIYTEERFDVLVVPNKAFRFIPEIDELGKLGINVVSPETEASEGKRLVWAKQGSQLLPKLVEVGTSDANVTEIVSGLSEGDEVAFEITEEAVEVATNSTDRNPFMPGPPGG